MPRFNIVPSDRTLSQMEIIAPDTAIILSLIERFSCKEADVWRGDDYLLSVRTGGEGLWYIFQRRNPPFKIGCVQPLPGRIEPRVVEARFA